MAGQCRQKAEVVVQPYLKADQPSSKDFGGVQNTSHRTTSSGVPDAPKIQFKHYLTLFFVPVL